MGNFLYKKLFKDNELLNQGFGGLHNVGKAAVKGPILLTFSYKPSGASEDIAFIGKGIVFDTGGINLKTSASMLSLFLKLFLSL